MCFFGSRSFGGGSKALAKSSVGSASMARACGWILKKFFLTVKKLFFRSISFGFSSFPFLFDQIPLFFSTVSMFYDTAGTEQIGNPRTT